MGAVGPHRPVRDRDVQPDRPERDVPRVQGRNRGRAQPRGHARQLPVRTRRDRARPDRRCRPPRGAWWAAAPAIGLCATIPWFIEQKNLDAHWGNAIPALGVVIAAVLTARGDATRRRRHSHSRRPWDTARVDHRRRRPPDLVALAQRGARLPLPRRRLHGGRGRSPRRTARSSPRFTSATITARTVRCC